MAKIILLGTANAIPDEYHENTHMVLVGENRTVLIDCVSNQILRLRRAGIHYDKLTDMILTHFHPDHVSGVPQLLMNMWLMGREKSLNIYGLHYTLDRMEDLMGFYGWSDWPNFFPVAFHRLPAQEMVTILEDDEFSIHASTVKHMIPAIGLRIEAYHNHKVLAYSCDTEPCDEVVRLAKRADILIHEATGPFVGHSSALQAGQIAQKADVGVLYLIHYPTGEIDKTNFVHEAQKNFSGPVILSEDLMVLEI